MADDDVVAPSDAQGQAAPDAQGQPPGDDETLPSPDERGTAEDRPTEVAVLRVSGSPAVQWRKRALTVRAAVPQLARNPVVVGASAAVATVALRVAAEVVQRALGNSAPSRPRTVAVTGSILHEVHVVRHVHVIHHVVHHYPYGPVSYLSRWSPP